jgi:hypothetical protein
VLVDGASQGAIGSYTFSNVTANHTISATFAVSGTPNDSVCSSITAPSSVTPGQVFSATIAMQNTGTNTWTTANSYKLGAQNPQDNTNWNASARVPLPSTTAPGSTATFSANFTAPSTVGTYNFDWKMVQEFVQWYGATCSKSITVAATPPATCQDSTANNFGGALPCTYDAAPDTVTVNARNTTTTPGATTTITYSVSVSSGNTDQCRPLDSNQATIPGYTSWKTSTTTFVMKSSLIPVAEGHYTSYFYVTCRDSGNTSLTDVDPMTLDVCATGKTWDAATSKCAYPPDLTAGPITPIAAVTNTNTTFSGTLYNNGEKSSTHFDYFFQTATGPGGTGTLNDLTSSRYSGTLNGGGQSIIVQKSAKFTPAGTYSMRLCADKKNRNDNGSVTEWNAAGDAENNNCGPWTDICVNASGACAAPPQITSSLSGNNTPNGTLNFSCTNSTTYSISRDGTALVTNHAYSSAVAYPVTIQGNYTMTCANGAQTDSDIIFYDPNASVAAALILNGTPRTIEAGGK